jgi:predicted transglutaminase-like cysteine proteinase
MRHTIKAALAAALATALMTGQTGGAAAQSLASLPGRTAPAQAVGEARPVIAWTTFCRSYPAECAVDRSEPAQIALTPQVWQQIVATNRRVNTTVRAVTDLDHWGQPDVWDLAEDGTGDCEDYQLLKRHLLVGQGLPRRAMRMTVVIDEKGEGHAVLMVRTDRGDLVLDNKTDAILPWHQTGYTYVKRESQDAVAWVSLGGATSPVATANR